MKIGLTGGTGFIGQYLIRDYGNQMEFIVPTRKNEFSRLEKGAQYITSDYSKEDFKRIFAKCDAVVHLGSYVMHGMCYELDVDIYLENVRTSSNLFEACRELNIKNIINASSMAVYDQIDEIPMKESAPCQPNSVYGIMKIPVEKLAELYNRRYGLKIKNFRFAQGIGVQAHMELRQFWTILLKNSVEGIPIPLYGKGRTGRDIIYVKDMTAAIIAGLCSPLVSGCFNIGTGHICSNREIAEAYCNIFGNAAGIIYLENQEENGIRTCMDCQKAKRELGFSPKYNVMQMVQDIKNEYEKYVEEGTCVSFY